MCKSIPSPNTAQPFTIDTSTTVIGQSWEGFSWPSPTVLQSPNITFNKGWNPTQVLGTAFQFKDHSFSTSTYIKYGKLPAHWKSTTPVKWWWRFVVAYNELNAKQQLGNKTWSLLGRSSIKLVIHSNLFRKLSMNLEMPRSRKRSSL